VYSLPSPKKKYEKSFFFFFFFFDSIVVRTYISYRQNLIWCHRNFQWLSRMVSLLLQMGTLVFPNAIFSREFWMIYFNNFKKFFHKKFQYLYSTILNSNINTVVTNMNNIESNTDFDRNNEEYIILIIIIIIIIILLIMIIVLI
jgi:hypothetical protein